jgi:hypothetical protein
MNRNNLVMRVLLALVCLVNLFLGIMAFTSKDMILDVIRIIYRVPLSDLAEHTVYIIKMLGCFLIAIALMAGLAIRDPMKNRLIIIGNATWLILRGIQRITYVERFHADWSIPYPMLWGQIVFVFLFAFMLIWFMPRQEKIL